MKSKYLSTRTESSVYELNLTAMVDMFTIILIFLLRSYSTSAVQLTPADRLSLPASYTSSHPVEALKMIVGKHGIYVDDVKVIELAEGRLDKKEMDSKDPQFLRALFNELDKQAQKSRDIAAVNESLKFDGKIILQADRDINYALLKKVMYTATIAGFNDVKMAAVAVD
ncbi:MAG: ExbD/TolR family protein [Bdellovibrionales bacterium]